MQHTHPRWIHVALLAASLGLGLVDCAQVEKVSDELIAAGRQETQDKDASVDDTGAGGEGGEGAGGENGTGGDPGAGGGGSETAGSEGTGGSAGKGSGGSAGKGSGGSAGKADGGPVESGTGGIGTGGGGTGGQVTPEGGTAGNTGGGGSTPEGGPPAGVCTPTKTYDLSKGNANVQDLGTAEVCIAITGKKPMGWSCSNMEKRTITVNGTPITCASTTFPALVEGGLYFLISSGDKSYASMSFW